MWVRDHGLDIIGFELDEAFEELSASLHMSFGRNEIQERKENMANDAPIVKISGLGGVFFRSKDPDALALWYKKNFGISMVADGPPWMQEAGPTVFSPFPSDTNYFGRDDQPCMFNFRVDDIETAVSSLQTAGVRIDEERMNESYGNFAWVYDPEGNKIELWEPKNPA